MTEEEKPHTIPRLPEVAKVRIEDRRNPFPMTAVVQVVDYYLKEKDDEFVSMRSQG